MDQTWQEIWYKSKRWVGEELGMSNDLMHVHFGLCAFLLIVVLLRNFRFGWVIAWLVVAALQLANELVDAGVWITWTGRPNWVELTKDFFWTLWWPTILVVVYYILQRPKSDTTPRDIPIGPRA